MHNKLYWNTVTPMLRTVLDQLMGHPLLSPFRLVGGTSLSLQLGHRVSVDIDLFTDATYGSIDFDAINDYLSASFPYISLPVQGPIGMGRSCFVGISEQDAVKLDLYYTDTFIRPALTIEHVRMATLEEIIAMKMDIVQRGGRKKDFWDLHELLGKYSLQQMIGLHKERYPFGHDEIIIRSNFKSFISADDDFDPDCLRGKFWEIIKLDLIEAIG